MCGIPASQDKIGCLRYTQDVTGTTMVIPSANGTVTMGALRVPPSTIIIRLLPRLPPLFELYPTWNGTLLAQPQSAIS